MIYLGYYLVWKSFYNMGGNGSFKFIFYDSVFFMIVLKGGEVESGDLNLDL